MTVEFLLYAFTLGWLLISGGYLVATVFQFLIDSERCLRSAFAILVAFGIGFVATGIYNKWVDGAWTSAAIPVAMNIGLAVIFVAVFYGVPALFRRFGWFQAPVEHEKTEQDYQAELRKINQEAEWEKQKSLLDTGLVSGKTELPAREGPWKKLIVALNGLAGDWRGVYRNIPFVSFIPLLWDVNDQGILTLNGVALCPAADINLDEINDGVAAKEFGPWDAKEALTMLEDGFLPNLYLPLGGENCVTIGIVMPGKDPFCLSEIYVDIPAGNKRKWKKVRTWNWKFHRYVACEVFDEDDEDEDD